MKLKRYFLGMAAILTLVGMSSCKGDYDDWAGLQTNPEEDAVTIPGFTSQTTSSETNPINLNNAQPVKDSVNIATLQVPAEYQYGVTNVRVVLKPTGEGAKSTVSKTFDLSSNCNMDSATIQQYVSDSYGLKPVPRKFSATVLASAKTGNDYVYVKTGTFDVYVEPKAPVLSEVGYYVVGNVKGAVKADGKYGWNENDTQFKYELGGADPYSNPEFTIRVPAKELTYGDHLEFKLLDLAHKGDWNAPTVLGGDAHTYDLTVDEKKPVTTKLIDNGKGGNIQFAGTTKQYYIIHVNLLDQTVYATAEDIPQLFMTGANYGWGDKWMELTMVNGNQDLFWTVKYFDKDEQFKFAPQAGWDNSFSPVCDGGDQASHFAIDGGNVKCSKAGWYLLVVDRAKHTFKTYTPKVYLMGDTSTDGWGNRTSADLFSTPATRDGNFVSPALKNNNAVRIYVEIPETDWWRAEFGVAANKSIQYRGNSGSDGASFTSGAGKKVYLNFSTETGDIK
ncbi:Outer membrane protein SusF domain-containing protein [Hallella absiana]|uniref:Outer membrane protein SusF domain-containing protein n=1 Tax=Hallella absiana TaxID=2925336 RepID=UPI0021C5DC75|nr:DUF5115 domain-containing protein [Hallella absiana]